MPGSFIPIETVTPPQKVIKPDWVIGSVISNIGPVDQVSTEWSSVDKKGQIKARCSNRFRMKYYIQPGLYAVGNPDQSAMVLLSANYKLSFDMLRRALKGLNVWIIVLDTKGINVWCAAGKGTFGTQEILRQIAFTRLDQVVSHRKIISPQLGAPGIEAHLIKQKSGFRVYYGPVYARDIPTYLKNGLKADSEMRQIHFNIIDRAILTPMELSLVFTKSWKYLLLILVFFGLMPTGIFFEKAILTGGPFILLLIAGVLSGAFFTPLLLPWIPFKSFTIKGFFMGLIPVVLAHITTYQLATDSIHPLLLGALYLLVPSISAYLAFNFTGCTTFTSPSGVNKELKRSVIPFAISIITGLILLILYKLSIWGIF